MPKRKSNPSIPVPAPSISLSSFDAALDLMACETFARLETLSLRFEAAAGIKLNDGVAKHRWEEAVARYWMTRSMEQCCMAMASGSSSRPAEIPADGEVKMESKDEEDCSGLHKGRPLPFKLNPGAAVVHSLNEEEAREWRRWTPKVGDVILVDLPERGIWPGKIIDKRVFYQGRTVPRGNHFFPVRLYQEDIEATVTVKSRLIPLHLRPTPPLLASESQLSAYLHAANPESFDMLADAREAREAHKRTHPGVAVCSEVERESRFRTERAAWNEVVNWVMGERRLEKLRALAQERERRLKEVTKVDDVLDGLGSKVENRLNGDTDTCRWVKKVKTTVNVALLIENSPGSDGMSEDGQLPSLQPTSSWGRSGSPARTIFGPSAIVPCSTPRRTGSPSLVGFIRPALSTPQRPSSPRRLDKKRSSIYSGMGEYSPRGRGGTYTPPRILPSGDETAPSGSNGSPAPSLRKFDFVSPLGPVKLCKLSNGDEGTPSIARKASLEAVKEDPGEDDGKGWTVVQGKRGRRAGSLPCREKAEGLNLVGSQGEGMDVGA